MGRPLICTSAIALPFSAALLRVINFRVLLGDDLRRLGPVDSFDCHAMELRGRGGGAKKCAVVVLTCKAISICLRSPSQSYNCHNHIVVNKAKVCFTFAYNYFSHPIRLLYKSVIVSQLNIKVTSQKWRSSWFPRPVYMDPVASFLGVIAFNQYFLMKWKTRYDSSVDERDKLLDSHPSSMLKRDFKVFPTCESPRIHTSTFY